MHGNLWDMSSMLSIHRCIAGNAVLDSSQSLWRVKVKEHWRDALAPPSVSNGHKMRVLCTLDINIHVILFN
jgi:hypothetical protein